LPAEEVPPEIPEPALGINFAREGMKVGGWVVPEHTQYSTARAAMAS
jgi:hypothetical protein